MILLDIAQQHFIRNRGQAQSRFYYINHFYLVKRVTGTLFSLENVKTVFS